MEFIRILLVDDQPAVRQGLRMRLEIEPGLQVVGEAPDGQIALSLARQLGPDLVIMDVEMPRMDGMTAARQMRERSPNIKVILHTIYGSPTLRRQAVQIGAAAFIEKQEGQEVLIDTIRRLFGKGVVQ